MDFHEIARNADADQLLAELEHLAMILAAYRRQLFDQGFSQDESFLLVMQLQTRLIDEPKTL